MKRPKPDPKWKLPTEAEAEALGDICFRCGPDWPGETISTLPLLLAWSKGYLKAKVEAGE